ncbi:MAG: AMP-binding protein [Hamadaea sp.]|nr:AMP-binding protein [Hamadaea sp.]
MRQTIPAAIHAAADAHGDAVAVLEPDGVRWTWSDLAEQAATAAGAFAASGVAPGDRVALWAPNSPEWIVAALGAWCAGATVVPINTRFTAAEAQDVLQRGRVRALVVTGPFLGVDRLNALRDIGGLPQIIVPLPGWQAFLSRAGTVAAVTVDVAETDVADIMFTSGTTGRSKGALGSHRQALANARVWARRAGLTADDRYLAVNPFFHSFGLKAGILACLVSGATLVPLPVFDAARALALIEQLRITVLPGAPTVYQTLLDHPDRPARDLSSLRLAVTGAATVPTVLVERMRDVLGFDVALTAYGLTEAVVATMCRPGDDPALVARSCGRPVDDMELRLGADAEVLLRGPNVMLGYLDDPEATRQAIDADGWLHTGDVGVLDERGYLTITDRLKDMYICGGFNVYPAEVEQVLARLDGVAEAAVVGVPDERLGEVGKAFVVPRPGAALDAGAVVAHCRRVLANYKVPRQVEFRAKLPRNASGKALKRLLREESNR